MPRAGPGRFPAGPARYQPLACGANLKRPGKHRANHALPTTKAPPTSKQPGPRGSSVPVTAPPLAKPGLRGSSVPVKAPPLAKPGPRGSSMPVKAPPLAKVRGPGTGSVPTKAPPAQALPTGREPKSGAAAPLPNVKSPPVAVASTEPRIKAPPTTGPGGQGPAPLQQPPAKPPPGPGLPARQMLDCGLFKQAAFPSKRAPPLPPLT